MNKILFIFLIFLLCITLTAQDLNVKAYADKTKLGLNEMLKITVEVSGEDTDVDFDFPRINNFRNHGVSQSSSSSFQFINGKTKVEKTRSYTASLSPIKTGKFNIPSFEVKYKGKTYKTKSIKIIVTKDTQAPKSSSSTRRKSADTDRTNSSANLNDNLFIKVRPHDTKVYVGQPLIVDFYLYSRYDVTGLDFTSEADYDGFWKEDLYVPDRFRFNLVRYQGKKFNRMLLKTVSLIPTEPGNKRIENFELKVEIRTQSRSFFDFGSSKSYRLRNNPVNIRVMELPKNSPSTFDNAVGDFEIASSITKDKLKVGESLTYTLKIEGEGNLEYLNPPKIGDINNFRVFEPESKTDMRSTRNKVKGSLMVKYPIIAQESGEYKLPAVYFSFFDPELKKFITKKTKSYNIEVMPGDGNIIYRAGKSQSVINLEGQDIAHVIDNYEIEDHTVLFSKIFYWIIWFIILLTLPIAIIYANEKEKMSSNYDYFRSRRAKKILKKYLKKASEFKKENKIEFYSAAQNGLTHYLADKMKLPKGSTNETLLKNLEKQIEDKKTIKQIKDFFELCNKMRFMPGDKQKQSINTHFEELKQIIQKISKKL